MPGFTPQIGDVLQFRITCRAGNQISQNVLHYRVESLVGGGLQQDTIAFNYETGIAPLYKAWMPIDADWEEVTVQNIMFPITNPSIANLQAGAGTATAGLVPRQVSGLIGTRTANGGRNQRGRVYVGFPSKSFVDTNGELTAGGHTVLLNIAAAIGSLVVLTSGGLTTTIRLLVRHPDFPGPPRVPNGSAVVQLTASQGLATQKRRGDFGRANPPV